MVDRADRAQPAVSDVMREFNPYLHGSRGLFALMIVLFHVVNSGLPTFDFLRGSGVGQVWRSLQFGVELFFAVSGIVIVGALSRARGPLIFAIERATRIYPVLWVTVILVDVFGGAAHFHGRDFSSVLVLTENLLALPPLLPAPLIHPYAWSLSYELCFYTFCAFAWALRRWLGAWSWLFVGLAGALLVGSHLRAILMPVGMAVAVVLARRPSWVRFAPAPALGLIVFLAAWGVLCNQRDGDMVEISLLDLGHGYTPLLLPVAIIGAVFAFAGLLGGRGWLALTLNTWLFQFLGSISYSLYLWHPIVLAVVKFVMRAVQAPHWLGPASQLVFLLLVLPPSLAIAWVSQQTLEKRVTGWLRRRLERGFRSDPSVTATVSTRLNGNPRV